MNEMAGPVDDPRDIVNWCRLDERLTTSGQPDEAQLARLAALGVRTVINLGLHDHERALADERASLEALGITYIHIPVPWEAPEEVHFDRFCEAMDAAESAPVHVHCVMNWRVSGFIYRYRRDCLGWNEAEARTPMLELWDPQRYPAWAIFLASSSTTPH